jgi:hypothetical protein
MRRSYISPEFSKTNVFGSFNSFEESNFFGSKMLEIEDIIEIKDQNIIYYQNSKNEQIDINVESTQNSTIYSSFDTKQLNHKLIIDESQPINQKKKKTRWLIDIDTNTILTEFIFANIKKERTFQSLTSDMVVSKDVNVYIRNYIQNNVLDRYRLIGIDLFIDYLDINSNGNLRYKNIFDKRTFNRFDKFRLETKTNNITLTFDQEKDSDQFSFKYFFNLRFEKI